MLSTSPLLSTVNMNTAIICQYFARHAPRSQSSTQQSFTASCVTSQSLMKLWNKKRSIHSKMIPISASLRKIVSNLFTLQRRTLRSMDAVSLSLKLRDYSSKIWSQSEILLLRLSSTQQLEKSTRQQKRGQRRQF